MLGHSYNHIWGFQRGKEKHISLLTWQYKLYNMKDNKDIQRIYSIGFKSY